MFKKLILSILIIFLLPSLCFSGALEMDEAVIAAKNAGGGCSFATENFSAYTEVDVLDRITVDSGTQVTLTDFDRDDDRYLYIDKGAGYFSGDFTHRFVITPSSATAQWSMVGFAVLANEIDDYKGIYDGAGETDDLIVFRVQHNANLNMSLLVYEDGVVVPEVDTPVDWAAGSWDTTYYVTITRDDDGGDNSKGVVTATIRITSHAGAVQATLTNNELTEQNDFQYLYAVSAMNNGTSEDHDGVLQTLELKACQP